MLSLAPLTSNYSNWPSSNPALVNRLRPNSINDGWRGFGHTIPFSPLLSRVQQAQASSDSAAFNATGQVTQSPQDQATLQQALNLLGNIQNLPGDESYMKQLGIHIIFRNGQEALNLIRAKGIKVEFGDMGDSAAHAQWIADKKLIMINQRYRGDNSPATQYAISEAIYHEAGHAAKLVQHPITKLTGNLSVVSSNPNDVGDDTSSIQEELDCLALNTLAYRYHTAIDPAYAQTISSSRLLSDGVALYTKLFFDPDPKKQALIQRVVEKYGDLPLSSPGHEPPAFMGQNQPIAYQVAWQAECKKAGSQPSTQPSLSFTPPPGSFPGIPQPNQPFSGANPFLAAPAFRSNYGQS